MECKTFRILLKLLSDHFSVLFQFAWLYLSWIFLAENIVKQNVDLIYKSTNRTYLKILAYKSQEFIGNRHFLCLFPSEHSTHICTRFCYLFYHHHLWLRYCCWQDHSWNSCHKQLEPLILFVQESMVESQIFPSQSFFRFLTQYQTKIVIH